MEDGGILSLRNAVLIGRGGSKDVYIDPRDGARCIKINARDKNPRDLRMEMAYRKARRRRGLPPSTLMVAYYGTVETDLGRGYVFERIADYDGETSLTIDDLIRLELAARTNEGASLEHVLSGGAEVRNGRCAAGSAACGRKLPRVVDVLVTFRETLFRENIIIPDMGAFNYAVQFDAPDVWRVRIVDDLGSPMLVPLYYYIDVLAAGHVRRRWVRFIREIMTLYPALLTDGEAARLMDVRDGAGEWREDGRMADSGFVSLQNAVFIGRGSNKAVYVDPRDETRCIKINVDSWDANDVQRDIAYRKARRWRGLPNSALMVAYYGTVETDLGRGYVFERIADYDGETSLTIDALIRREIVARTTETADILSGGGDSARRIARVGVGRKDVSARFGCPVRVPRRAIPRKSDPFGYGRFQSGCAV